MAHQVLALDFGYGFTKAIYGSHKTIIPSVVGPSQIVRFGSSGLGESVPLIVSLKGEDYFVGDYARTQSPTLMHTLSPTRTGSKEELALFYAVATEVVQPGSSEVFIVTGLPIGEYNADNRTRLHRMLNGRHIIHRPRCQDRLVTVLGVYSIPQPMGTFYSHLLDAEGNINNLDLATRTIGIIDIGTFTVNFTLIKGSRYLEQGSDSVNYGMSRAYRVVAKQLRDRFGTDYGSDLFAVDQIYRDRGVMSFGKFLQITDFDTITRTLFEGILSKARGLWGSGSQIDTMILSGGGAYFLHDYFLLEYPNLIVAKDPQMANVLGYQRIGIRRRKR